MVRTIIKPENNQIILDLPDDLIGKTVEVIAFEIDEASPKANNKLKPSELRGFLSADTAKKMQDHIEKDRKAWDS